MAALSKFALKIRKLHNSVTFEIHNSPFYIKMGDWIVVETNRGEELGQVVKLPLPCKKCGLHENIQIRNILRVATEQDIQTAAEIPLLEKELFLKTNQWFEQKAVGYKVINCELLFSKKKLMLFYRRLEADSQGGKPKQQHKKKDHKEVHKEVVSFNVKEANRELFALLNIPIDLKEMGNRASAYVIGGVGHCGCKLCCTSWLHKTLPVSIKMAKEQALAINIPKLTGVCGKLMCCLSYETGQYADGVLKDTPRVKKAEEAEFKEFLQ